MPTTKTDHDKLARRIASGLNRLPAFKKTPVDENLIAAILIAAIGDATVLSPSLSDAPATYSIATVQRRLPISRSKIYDEIRAGRLEKIKIGSRTLITAESVEAYIDRARVPPP